jgi:hypothetical protein
MAPGDRIPTQPRVNRHPYRVRLMALAERIKSVQVRDITFLPRNTWIGAGNIGTEAVTLSSVFSIPKY